MQIVRTVFWVALTIVLVAFIAINWEPVRVNLWPQQDSYLYVNWPVGFIVLVSFLAGLMPMWLLHRGSRWRLNRRISSLENSVRSTTVVTPPPAVQDGVDAPSAQLHEPPHA